MKNKRGFTLVEIIVVVTIIAVIAGIFTVNMIHTLNEKRKEDNSSLITQITSAADAYVSTNPNEVEKLYQGYGYVDITVGQLKDAGLLKRDLKDVETGEMVSDEETVRVSLQTGDYIKTKFPLTEEEKNIKFYTLVAEDLFVEYNKNQTTEQWCNDDNLVYSGLFDSTKYTKENYASVTSKLYLMDNADDNRGAIYNENHREEPMNLKISSCNVNPQIAGTYSLSYIFNDPETHVERSVNRNVYVRTSGNDIISFTATINDGKPIPIGTSSVKVTITESSKDGSTPVRIETTNYNISNVGYAIENFSTSTKGTRVAKISSKKVNSDGSIPQPVDVSYNVTDSFEDVISSIPLSCSGSVCYVTCSQSNNYVRYNGNIYRLYAKEGSNFRFIYNGTNIVGPYGQLGSCTNNSCCNGGRYIYNHLGDDASGIGTTMDDSLDSFYYNYNVYSAKLQSQSTPYGSKKVSLLSIEEYNGVSRNGSCPNNYLTGTTFWLVNGSDYDTGAENYNRGRKRSYSYGYAVLANGQMISNAGATHATTYEGDYGISNVKTDRYAIRPTIALNNPKYRGGEGTLYNPFVIEG